MDRNERFYKKIKMMRTSRPQQHEPLEIDVLHDLPADARLVLRCRTPELIAQDSFLADTATAHTPSSTTFYGHLDNHLTLLTQGLDPPWTPDKKVFAVSGQIASSANTRESVAFEVPGASVRNTN